MKRMRIIKKVKSEISLFACDEYFEFKRFNGSLLESRLTIPTNQKERKKDKDQVKHQASDKPKER